MKTKEILIKTQPTQGSFYLQRLYNYLQNEKCKKEKCLFYSSEENFYEEEYKYHQLIVVEETGYLNKVFLNGVAIEDCVDDYDTNPNYVREPMETRIRTSAYAYRLGTTSVVANLDWLGSCSVFYNSFLSDNPLTTIKKARKKLDIYGAIVPHADRLTELPHNKLFNVHLIEPYNVKINDEVWCHVFGAWRNGKIVGIQGSKFIFAYVTPSNPTDLKYKLLSLSQLRILKNEPIKGQEHNFHTQLLGQ